MMLPFSRATLSPYYDDLTFGLFAPVAVAYSFVAHCALGLLRPLVPRLQTPMPPSWAMPPRGTPPRRLAIVTGSNTGIGYRTAHTMAVIYHYHVILACRNVAAGAEAAQNIQAQGGVATAHELDLADPSSITAFVCDIRQQQYPPIAVLVNNAGRNTSGAKTSQNIDLLFQTNFLGHYQLTAELLPCMAQNARVVNVSSVMHHFCGAGVEDINDAATWKRIAAGEVGSTYALTKLCSILFSHELNCRYFHEDYRGVHNPTRVQVAQLRSFAVNPGAVNSDIWRSLPFANLISKFFSLVYLNNQQGCRTSVEAAVADWDHDVTALYLQPYWLPSWWSDTRVSPPFPVPEMLSLNVGCRVTTPRLPQDVDAAAKAMWQACEELTGVSWPKVPLATKSASSLTSRKKETLDMAKKRE